MTPEQYLQAVKIEKNRHEAALREIEHEYIMDNARFHIHEHVKGPGGETLKVSGVVVLGESGRFAYQLKDPKNALSKPRLLSEGEIS